MYLKKGVIKIIAVIQEGDIDTHLDILIHKSRDTTDLYNRMQ